MIASGTTLKFAVQKIVQSIRSCKHIAPLKHNLKTLKSYSLSMVFQFNQKLKHQLIIISVTFTATHFLSKVHDQTKVKKTHSVVNSTDIRLMVLNCVFRRAKYNSRSSISLNTFL